MSEGFFFKFTLHWRHEINVSVPAIKEVPSHQFGIMLLSGLEELRGNINIAARGDEGFSHLQCYQQMNAT